MIKYEIIESNEIPELTKIRKSGIEAEITLARTLEDIAYNEKGIKQIDAEVRLKKAIMANVAENHPGVLDLDEKMLIAAYMYHEASRYAKIGEEKLEEFKKAQDELQLEVSEIKSQLGIEKKSAETLVANAEAVKE